MRGQSLASVTRLPLFWTLLVPVAVAAAVAAAVAVACSIALARRGPAPA